MTQPLAFTSLSASHLRGASAGLCAIGVVGLVVCGMAGGSDWAWAGVLGTMVVPAILGIGAWVFLAIHLAAGATWITPYRALLGGMGGASVMAFLPALALMVGGGAVVYDWWGRSDYFHSESKNAWMIPMRWMVSMGVIGVLWLMVDALLRRAEARVRPGGDSAAAMARWGVIALLVLVPSFTLFIWDALLALNASFVSAMWGFYHLAGGMQCALAALILLVLYLARSGHARLAAPHLLHDLGTWMVAGACVISYIAFAQYLIISFANMPEETQFFVRRAQHGYGVVHVAEVLLRLSPFLILMSQSLRTRPEAMVVAALAVLAGGTLDLAWVLVPHLSPDHQASPLQWIGILMAIAGGCGLWLATVAFRLGRAPVAPNQDARLHTALSGDHLH